MLRLVSILLLATLMLCGCELGSPSTKYLSSPMLQIDNRISKSLIDGSIEIGDLERVVFTDCSPPGSPGNWGDYSSGLRQTALTVEEVQRLLQIMKAELVDLSSDQLKRDGLAGSDVGCLLFFHKSGKQGVAHIARRFDRLLYLLSGPWRIKFAFGDSSAELVAALRARARVQKDTPVLYPELSEKEANKKAIDIVGAPYNEARNYFVSHPVVIRAIGKVKEARPAFGRNWYKKLPDYYVGMFTIKLVGSAGSAVATVIVVHEDGISRARDGKMVITQHRDRDVVESYLSLKRGDPIP